MIVRFQLGLQYKLVYGICLLYIYIRKKANPNGAIPSIKIDLLNKNPYHENESL